LEGWGVGKHKAFVQNLPLAMKAACVASIGRLGIVAAGLVFGLVACNSGNGCVPGYDCDIEVERTLDGVEIQSERLRSTPGGCAIDVTFRNATGEDAIIGFTYDVFDPAGRKLGSLSTGNVVTPPGETRTVSTFGPNGIGASGIPCSEIAQFQLTEGGRLIFREGPRRGLTSAWKPWDGPSLARGQPPARSRASI